jgi:hypothetical protein
MVAKFIRRGIWVIFKEIDNQLIIEIQQKAQPLAGAMRTNRIKNKGSFS